MNRKVKISLSDLISSLIFLALALFLIFETRKMPPPFFDILGPAFFPRFILVSFILLSLTLLIQAFFPRKEENEKKVTVDKPTYFLSWGLLAIFILYIFVLSMDWLNYIAATAIFLPVAMVFLAPRHKIRPIVFLIITLAGSFGIEYIMVNQLKMFLP